MSKFIIISVYTDSKMNDTTLIMINLDHIVSMSVFRTNSENALIILTNGNQFISLLPFSTLKNRIVDA